MHKYLGLLYPWDIGTASFIIAATSEHHIHLLAALKNALAQRFGGKT
jgi:hypothetical protein